jgi:hypothetical protein
VSDVNLMGRATLFILLFDRRWLSCFPVDHGKRTGL